MVAVVRDVELEQGATFELAVDCFEEDGTTPRTDLSGYSGSMQIRETVDSADVLATATVTVDDDAGVVLATIPHATTAAVTWRAGVYDLEITNGTRVERLARGRVKVTRNVTR